MLFFELDGYCIKNCRLILGELAYLLKLSSSLIYTLHLVCLKNLSVKMAFGQSQASCFMLLV